MTLALDVASDAQVTLVTKRERFEANTRYAQGGIAAVMSPDDTVAAHKEDTLIAGAGLCHDVVVERCVSEGPARMRELIERGARFDEKDGGLDLTREGGHSAR